MKLLVERCLILKASSPVKRPCHMTREEKLCFLTSGLPKSWPQDAPKRSASLLPRPRGLQITKPSKAKQATITFMRAGDDEPLRRQLLPNNTPLTLRFQPLGHSDGVATNLPDDRKSGPLLCNCRMSAPTFHNMFSKPASTGKTESGLKAVPASHVISIPELDLRFTSSKIATA